MCCLNWIFISMMTSIVVLNNEMQNIKLTSSELIIKSDAQKNMVEFSCGRRFDDLKYFKVGFFFSYSLNSLYILGHLHDFFLIENHHFNVLLLYSRQFLVQYHLLAPSSKICRLFLELFLSSYIAWLCRPTYFFNIYDFFRHKIQSQCKILNHFYLTLGKNQVLSTLPCLPPPQVQDAILGCTPPPSLLVTNKGQMRFVTLSISM